MRLTRVRVAFPVLPAVLDSHLTSATPCKDCRSQTPGDLLRRLWNRCTIRVTKFAGPTKPPFVDIDEELGRAVVTIMAIDDHDFVVLGEDDVSDYNAAGILPESLETIQKIQQWLEPTDFAADSSEYKKHLNSYVAGTGNWIQRTEAYQTWHESPNSSSLWIKAIPGAGKSVFAAMIAEKLSRTEKVPVLYFFFRQIIAKNHDPQYLVRDWLSQLLPYSPFLQSKLKRPMEGRQGLDNISTAEFWHSLLLAMACIPKLYCVADALDEMDISKLGFLDRLVELGKEGHSTVKLLMTSRPLPRIESKLRMPSVLEISILQIRLQQNMVDTDIAIYVDHRLHHLDDADVRETIRTAICTKGQGSFLYARLMMDELLDDTSQISRSSSEDLEQRMKKLPLSLEEMYNGMLFDHAFRSGVPQELQLTILQWVTHSVRPLRLLELAAMIDSLGDSERTLKDTKALVRTACGPLLEILEDETLSIIHHSFTEFLLDQLREGRASVETGNGQLPVIKSPDTHRLLALTCLKYLTSGRLAQWELLDELHVTSSYRKADINMKHPFLSYAASNICAHVARFQASDEVLFAALDGFMKPGNHEFDSWVHLAWSGHRTTSGLHISANYGMVSYCQHLIELGHLDINGVDSHGRRPISYACQKGHAEIVKILLQNGANADDPDDCQEQGLEEVPLHYAAMANHYAVVRLLLAAGVDPHTIKTKNSRGTKWSIASTPLQHACRGGCLECVLEFRAYLSDEDVNQALRWAVSGQAANVVTALLEFPNVSIDSTDNDDGITALYIAAKARNPGMIRALLEKGADPNARSNIFSNAFADRIVRAKEAKNKNLRRTPLHAVSLDRGHSRVDWFLDSNQNVLRDCCGLLIDAGGDVNATDAEGNCPIHYSTSPTVTSILLQHGAKATVESMDGSTPLHFTCYMSSADSSSRERLFELLVRHGADINAKRRVDGKTPLHLLVDDIYLKPPSFKSFLSYGLDVNAGDKDGNTPLHVAVLHPHVHSKEIIHGLLDAGADPNKTNVNMETPIHSMCPSSHYDVLHVLQSLVNAGADLEARDNLGRTCLLRSLNDVDTVKKMLELGANLEARDIYGNSAPHLVCQKLLSDSELLRLLIEDAGADPKWINYKGNTLLHEASRVREKRIGPNQLVLLETLLELGVPSKQTNYSGATALHIACSTWLSCTDGYVRYGITDLFLKGMIDLLLSPKSNIGIDEGDKNGIRVIHLAATLSDQLLSCLVERGADPAGLTGEGHTPLQVACRARQTSVVGQLLELYQGRDLSHLIDWKDKRGRTALHLAARSGRPETVQLLLDAGADPNMKDCEGFTPLHVCSEFTFSEKIFWSSRPGDERGDLSMSGILQPSNLLIGDTEHPIGSAVHNRLPLLSMWTDIQSEHDTARIGDSIRLLLARGADVGALSKLGWMPLDSALSVGCEVMVSALLHATKKAFDNGEIQALTGKSPNIARNPFAEQYLSLRSKYSPRIVRDLVEEKDDNFEWSRLLRLDDEAVFDELINLQVNFLNVIETSRYRESFLETLTRWGYATLLEKSGPQVSMYHEDLSKKADRTIFRRYVPLLHLACSRELPNMAVLMVLVDKLGVDVNGYSTRGSLEQRRTVLFELARGQHWWHKGAVEFLLQRGADIEAKDEYGESPLSLCVGDHSPGFWRDAVADVLLRHGANPNNVAKDGSTCLAKASSRSNPAMIRKLVKHGAITDTPALLKAIGSQDLATVAAMIEAGASVNVRQVVKSGNDHGTSRMEKRARRRENVTIPAAEMMPLHYAASSQLNSTMWTRARALPIVRLLLENGADPYAVFDDDKTIVHYLLEFGGILQPFLELPTLDLEHRDTCGRTLLLAGCRSRFPASHDLHTTVNVKDPIVASILYCMGADITARDSEGMNALHHLLRTIHIKEEFMEAYLETFSVFVKDEPLLVHQKDLEGHTPLHYALRRKHVWYIETLLSAGGDPLEPDSSGDTALHHLAKVICGDPTRSEQTQLFKKFITLGVPINARNNAGETPLFHYITVNEKREISLRSETTKTLREDLTIFEEAGADFLARNNDMESLLHVAAKTGQSRTELVYNLELQAPVDRFRFLVEMGCDPLAEDINQRTPLDVAAAYGSKKILELFQRGEELKLAPEG